MYLYVIGAPERLPKGYVAVEDGQITHVGKISQVFIDDHVKLVKIAQF